MSQNETFSKIFRPLCTPLNNNSVDPKKEDLDIVFSISCDPLKGMEFEMMMN